MRKLQIENKEEIAIAFPDEGAEKRYSHYFKKACPWNPALQ